MRLPALPFAATAVFAAITLSSISASAQSAAEPPVVCAPLSVAMPAKLIESCTSLIDNPATADTDRLGAMVTRALALQNSGDTNKALAEIDAVVAKDPNLARAFRVRGEILRQSGQTQSAFDALNQAIKLDPNAAEGYESRGNVFNNTLNAPSSNQAGLQISFLATTIGRFLIQGNDFRGSANGVIIDDGSSGPAPTTVTLPLPMDLTPSIRCCADRAGTPFRGYPSRSSAPTSGRAGGLMRAT